MLSHGCPSRLAKAGRLAADPAPAAALLTPCSRASVALLPDPPGGQPSCEPWPERSLRLLKLPASSEAHDWVTCASRWLFSLVIVWSLCCLATDAGAVGTS